MKKEISLRHKVEMVDGKITSEWLVLNDETVPMNGIPMRISLHPDDVTYLIEELQRWNLYFIKSKQVGMELTATELDQDNVFRSSYEITGELPDLGASSEELIIKSNHPTKQT